MSYLRFCVRFCVHFSLRFWSSGRAAEMVCSLVCDIVCIVDSTFAVVELTSIDVRLPLAALYEGTDVSESLDTPEGEV